MGRRTIRPDFERRIITYIADKDDRSGFGSRILSWILENASKRTIDFGLGAAGAGTAVASVIFAGVMMTSDNSHPAFNGAEYLLLFTRPLQTASTANPPLAARRREFGIDYTATGSIGAAAHQNTPQADDNSPVQTSNSTDPPQVSAQPRAAYKLLSVSGGVATIKNPQGLLTVEAGSLLPNGDLVFSIDRRAGRWVVVTSGGLIEAQ